MSIFNGIKNSVPSSAGEIRAYIADGGEAPESYKIAGIRRVWHDLKCENFILECCLAAVLKQFGEPSDYYKNCALLQSISGTLFTLVYPQSSGAHGLSHELGRQLMPYICEQIGYSYLYIDNDTIKNQYELAREAVKVSVSKGIPVISYGMGNIPLDNGIEEHHIEWCNIGGYDKDDVLYVNSLHEGQSTCDENGYFFVRGGLLRSGGLYILDKKVRETNLADIARNAIRSIPALISMPSKTVFSAKGEVEISFGQKAYYDWADTMLTEKHFAEKNAFKKIYWFSYFSPWVTALTCECHMTHFFNKIAELSGMPEAIQVKEIYTKIYQNLGEIQRIHGGEFDANYDVIKNLEVRQELASVLRRMGDLHNELFELLEKFGV